MDAYAQGRREDDESKLRNIRNKLLASIKEIRVTTRFYNYLNSDPWDKKDINNPTWEGIPLVIDDSINYENYVIVIY